MILISAGSTKAGIIAVDSRINLYARSQIDSDLNEDFDSVAQGATLNPISVDVASAIINGSAQVAATESSSATWFSPSSFVYENAYQWSSSGLDASNTGRFSHGAFLTPPEISQLGAFYTFSSDFGGTLTLDYEILGLPGAGDSLFPFGSNRAYHVFFDDVLVAKVGDLFLENPSSGSFTGSFTPGTTHEIRIQNAGNLTGPGLNLSRHVEASFEITITENNIVPEPTSLAIFGLGALGLVVSRRRYRVTKTPR